MSLTGGGTSREIGLTVELLTGQLRGIEHVMPKTLDSIGQCAQSQSSILFKLELRGTVELHQTVNDSKHYR